MEGISHMADLTPVAEDFFVTIYFAAIDSNGVVQERSKTFELADSVTLHADAVTAVDALKTDLVATMEADILGYDLTTRRRVGVGGVTVVGNLRREAVLTLNSADDTDKLPHTLLAPDDTIVSGKNVNENDAGLLAYIANFQETGGDFRISDGEAVADTNPISKSRLRTTAQSY